MLTIASCGFFLLASLVSDEAAPGARKSLCGSGQNVRGKRRRRFGAASVLSLCLSLAMFCEAARADEPLYDMDIQSMNVAEALNRFAEQTGAIMLFPYDLASERQANAVRGRYTLLQGLELLLRGTGLSGGLSDKRVVNISRAEDRQRHREEGAMLKQKETLGTRLAALVASVFSVSASGQDAPSEPGSLEEIVVTAQKREERLQDVPISISVLSGDTLDRSSVTSIVDALTRVPGVVAFPDVQGGGTQMSVRGVGPSGPLFSGASPIGYYLDSVPFGLVRSAVSPDAGAYDLQRVEILRGPQGTLYGAGGANGVVRVLTNEADPESLDFKARSTLSSTQDGGENYRADMAANVPLVADKLALRAVVGYENQSGWIDNLVEEDTNQARLRTYRLKVNARPTENLTLGASAWISRNDYDAPSAGTQDGHYRGRLDQPMTTDYDAYGLKIGYDFASFSLTSMTSYLGYENTVLQDLAPTGLAAPALFTQQKADVLSQEITLTSTHAGPWRWSIGLFYRDGEDKVLRVFPGLQPGNDSVDRSESAAVFGELSRSFADEKWEWTLGLRRFHDDVLRSDVSRDPNAARYRATSSFDSTTPRAILTWRPDRDVTVYGSYAQGFRSGFPQAGSIALTFPEFPPLQPDKLHNYEVGAKADVADGRVSLEGAVYYIKWDDVQQTLSVAYRLAFPLAQVNSESASGIGADFGVIARPLDGLDLSLNFSWNDLTLDAPISSGGNVLYEKGDRLNYSPELTGTASAQYRFPMGASGFEGAFNLSGSYSSKQINKGLFNGRPFALAGDSTLIGRTSFSISFPNRWTVLLFVDNVTDEEGGYPPKVPVADFSPRVRPRTVGVQVDYHLR